DAGSRIRPEISMRGMIIAVLTLAAVSGVNGSINRAARAQGTAKFDDALLEWPLPPGEQAYARIDGKHLHAYVEEQAAIARRYRDQGHPKFWGRIIGSSADAENAAWLENKFKSLGMTDVRSQPLDLSPQWFP